MKLYYEKLPTGSHQPTLFIHGNLASSKWWKPTLNEWNKQGFKGTAPVYCVDWRGCGQNPAWTDTDNFTIDDLAQDFIDFIQEHKLTNVNLVAHSLGGLIAMQMMIKRPELFHKALLLDPVGAKGVIFDDSMYEAFRQMALSRELTGQVILSTIKDPSHITDSLKKDIIDDAFKAVKGIGTSVLEILKTVDISTQLKALKIPTLFLHGAHDAVIPLKDSEETVKLWPQAKLEVLSEAGHCWNVENPKDFTARLIKWFS